MLTSYVWLISFAHRLQGVNKVTKKDAYPLPSMTNILHELQKVNCISTIDLRQAFKHAHLDEKVNKLPRSRYDDVVYINFLDAV